MSESSQAPRLSRTEIACRSCGGARLEIFLDLGETPLADRLVEPARALEKELRFPLRLAFCHDCALVQVTETVDPAILFADHYPYYSSFSPCLLQHARENVFARLGERSLGPDSLVVELASNDGYLLRNYVEAGVPVLGIDPAEGPALAARKIGVRTEIAFFTEALGRDLAARGIRADVVHANNVLAHVADTNGFVRGLRALLAKRGVGVIEAPYLKALIEQVEFDTIYHEHLCYFSVTALDHLFRRNGLYLNRIEHLDIHGGSLRLFVERHEAPDATVIEALAGERADGLDRIDYFLDFSNRVQALTQDLTRIVSELKASGASIAAYGAAAKGATLLNVAGLNHEQLDFVVDRNTHKHGLMMPGARLPIRSVDALLAGRPTHVLLLAWNFASEILEQQQAYRAQGGKFIIPVPSPRIV
jgi:SAM-dependent methyltransferase